MNSLIKEQSPRFPRHNQCGRMAECLMTADLIGTSGNLPAFDMASSTLFLTLRRK